MQFSSSVVVHVGAVVVVDDEVVVAAVDFGGPIVVADVKSFGVPIMA